MFTSIIILGGSGIALVRARTPVIIPHSMSSLIQELESLGGGVFLTYQGVDSRVTEAELWKAFEQPVLIWMHGDLSMIQFWTAW